MMTRMTRRRKKEEAKKKEEEEEKLEAEGAKNSKRSTFTPIQIQLFIKMFALVMCQHVLMCLIGKLW